MMALQQVAEYADVENKMRLRGKTGWSFWAEVPDFEGHTKFNYLALTRIHLPMSSIIQDIGNELK